MPVAVYTHSKGPLAVDLTGQAILSFAALSTSLLATATVASRNDSSILVVMRLRCLDCTVYMLGSVAFELDRD